VSERLNPFRFDGAPSEAVQDFHRDGYAVLADAMTDEAREELIEEVVNSKPVSDFLAASPDERERPTYFVRPWNDREPWGDSFIDAPLVRSLLAATIEPGYHFCHSALNVAPRGVNRVQFHQDHHHWKHENPVNIAERHRYYIQILYYPNGFKRGDRSLSVIPGSHRVAPTNKATPEALLSGAYDEEAGRKLECVHLELPPGSFVYLNARTFHGVEPKPLDSPQPYRIFTIDIFKEAGPPHRHTQEISQAWMDRADSHRRKMFDREAYTEECWNTEL
jgi:ectoine hydroxylase-related dioxygenase (phytanoyl-CoA dioxygenase family)